MRMTSYATKIVLAVMAAGFIASCTHVTPGGGFQTFGTQPYPEDDYNPAGNAH